MLFYVNIKDRRTDKHMKSIVRNLTKYCCAKKIFEPKKKFQPKKNIRTAQKYTPSRISLTASGGALSDRISDRDSGLICPTAAWASSTIG